MDISPKQWYLTMLKSHRHACQKLYEKALSKGISHTEAKKFLARNVKKKGN